MGWLDELVSFAHSNLQGTRELEALWSRGVSDDQIQSYHIGYLGGLPPIHVPKEFAKWSRQGWNLSDVFVFPLTNALGQVKGLQFRHVTQEVRGYRDYLPVNDEPALFGLAQAVPHMWLAESVVLVEGVFDLFPVQRVIPNVISTLTSSVSSSFSRFLRRNVREIRFLYDMDAPGRKGVLEFNENYGKDFVIRSIQLPRVRLPDGRRAKDPGEVWEVVGDEFFGVYLRSALRH